MVRVKKQFKENLLKPCPYCSDTVIVIVDVDFEDGTKEAMRTLCKCGWSKKTFNTWYTSKAQLIEDYNDMIQEGEILTES